MLETRGTILVVEDDDAVRSLAARVLRREGYEVVEAADATRALEAAALSDHPIALLLTDLVLPGESGAELAGTLCAERPGLPVIYMSGFQETELENRGILAGAAYITKPFTADVLTLMVRGAIGH